LTAVNDIPIVEEFDLCFISLHSSSKNTTIQLLAHSKNTVLLTNITQVKKNKKKTQNGIMAAAISPTLPNM